MAEDTKTKHNRPVTQSLHDYARAELSSLYSSNRSSLKDAVEKLMDEQSGAIKE